MSASTDPVRVIADGLMARRGDWQGTLGPGFSLQEPDWPQAALAESMAWSAVKALLAAGYVVVPAPTPGAASA